MRTVSYECPTELPHSVQGGRGNKGRNLPWDNEVRSAQTPLPRCAIQHNTNPPKPPKVRPRVALL